jgi:hypothetical protein
MPHTLYVFLGFFDPSLTCMDFSGKRVALVACHKDDGKGNIPVSGLPRSVRRILLDLGLTDYLNPASLRFGP